MMMMNLTHLQVKEAHGLEVIVDPVGPEVTVREPRLGPAKVSGKDIYALVILMIENIL